MNRNISETHCTSNLMVDELHKQETVSGGQRAFWWWAEIYLLNLVCVTDSHRTERFNFDVCRCCRQAVDRDVSDVAALHSGNPNETWARREALVFRRWYECSGWEEFIYFLPPIITTHTYDNINALRTELNFDPGTLSMSIRHMNTSKVSRGTFPCFH